MQTWNTTWDEVLITHDTGARMIILLSHLLLGQLNHSDQLAGAAVLSRHCSTCEPRDCVKIDQKTSGKHLASRETQSERPVSIVLALQRKRKGKLGIGDSIEWKNSGQWSHVLKCNFKHLLEKKDPSQSSSKSKSTSSRAPRTASGKRESPDIPSLEK